MASHILLDTNGWIALLNASDSLHQAARTAWKQINAAGHRVVFTDWVVAETGNGLARTPARKNFVSSVESLVASPRAQLVIVTAELLDEALRLYRDRDDKARR